MDQRAGRRAGVVPADLGLFLVGDRSLALALTETGCPAAAAAAVDVRVGKEATMMTGWEVADVKLSTRQQRPPPPIPPID